LGTRPSKSALHCRGLGRFWGGACETCVRRYLERNPQLPLSLRQIDPLIRELVQYRELIEQRTKEMEP
jgi:hypothetical protein